MTFALNINCYMQFILIFLVYLKSIFFKYTVTYLSEVHRTCAGTFGLDIIIIIIIIINIIISSPGVSEQVSYFIIRILIINIIF